MRVTFKYVGSGDSIIIEWEDGIGFIDCKKLHGENPSLNYLKATEENNIRFVFMSHPHQDHYSGLYEFLDYCDSKDITIDLFAFTTDVSKNYLETVLMPYDAKKSLQKILLKAKSLEDKGIIKTRGLVNNLSQNLNLNDEIFLRILSPSQQEKDEFYKTLFNKDLDFKSAPNPNLLSLVTSIESNDWQILLTSDVEIQSLRRIGIKVLKHFDKEVYLGQIPHHGSLKNHYREFWKKRKFKNDTPVAISVGPNKNGHPSGKVISDLEDLGYQVDLTDERQRESNESASQLGLISNKVPESNEGSDLVYDI
ncbi:hypothetical protein [Fodinibius halophilus]|uniref:MBL fold metallo-hydrolase n=1 Tax=Fodinibius halophilus TaxID=1736908 RepID=A0A6M1T0H6_9BACT|nr:hypothetical protein [Fodinibius halophilus]NGP88986.1 hypothetical protein [Fodinibius halophilus]